MRIGVISDTHGDAGSWARAMDVFSGADLIIHAGDVLRPPAPGVDINKLAVPELAQMLNNCRIPLVIVKGEEDSPIYELVLDVPMQFPHAVVRLQEVSIVATHGLLLTREHFVQLARKHSAQIVVYGHTRAAALDRHDGIVLLNPGSPSASRLSVDRIPTPTVGLIEDHKVKIVELVDLGVITELVFS
jgi:putative phosphoesterase